MNFDLTEDQSLLLATCERWVRERCAIEARRAQVKTDPARVPATWRELSELGLAALRVPEASGGLGRPLIDAVLVAQTLGRGWLLEPLIDAAIAAPAILEHCEVSPPRESLLASIAAGAVVVPLRDVQADAQRLRGWAPHAACADTVLAFADDRLYAIDTGRCERDAYRQVDGTAAARIAFDAGAAVLAEGAAARAARQGGADAARIGRIAEGMGLAKTVLDLTAEYLRTRKQFGQPIGRFQALAHRMADLLVLHEQAQSLMLAAAMKMDGRTLDAAQVLAHRCLRTIAQQSIQLHGGIGMTADYALSDYVKRMFAIELELGDAETALARFAAAG